MNLTPFQNKRIFLTGQSGLVGQALWRALPDNMNINDPLRQIVEPDGADYIIHAAGYGQPDKFMADPIGTIKVNTSKLIAMLERLKPGGRFLYISTSELYSGSWKNSHAETDIGHSDPWHPRSMYIEGKRCGEAICAAYRAKGVNVKVARLSLAYGPGTRVGDTRVINQFIEQALITGRIEMKDQGNAVRTYCYIDDAVDMLLNILMHGAESARATAENLTLPYTDTPVFNVGGVSRTTIKELALSIAALTGAEVFTPPNDKGLKGAPQHVEVSLNKYRREIDDKTTFVDLHEGLKRTIEYQRKLYAA